MDAAAPAGTRRLRSLAAHVAPEHGVAPAGCVMAQGLAVAQPWLIAGLGSALWAAWPALMRQWRALNPRDALAGTALTKEQMEAFAQGLQAMAVAHAPGSISDANRNPRRVADVLHPKRAPMVALSGTARPVAMAKRLNFAKVLNERLGQDSDAHALAQDLVEKIGTESPFAETEVIEKTHDNWVSDAAGALNRDEMCAINGLCNKLQAEHGVQLGVITMSGAGKGTDRSFATEIFNAWGVGDRDANSGVLIVLTGLSLGPGRKKCHIVTGDGIAGAALSDNTCNTIIQHSMLRELRRGDFGTALVKGAKAVSQIVEHRSDNIARLGWRPPTKPEADFGGGKRSGSSWPQPGGPWPPLALAGSAAVGSWYISKQRCDHCGKYDVVHDTTTLPLDADWVDDAELALADLMDEEGRVPRDAAYTAITTAANDSKTAALIEPGRRGLLGKGMLDQLFMLEVPEPEKDFERDDESEKEDSGYFSTASRRERRERDAYRKELQAASDRKGTADFVSSFLHIHWFAQFTDGELFVVGRRGW